MTWWSASKTEWLPSDSWKRFGNDSPSSDWNYIRRKHDRSSLGGSPHKIGRDVEKGSQRHLRFWASHIFAGSAGENSSSGGKRRRSAWWPSCEQIKAELRLRRHEPIADVGEWLRKVVTGYYRYQAIPGNID